MEGRVADPQTETQISSFAWPSQISMDGFANQTVLWLAFGALAALILLHMMRRRQLKLIGLLKEYVDRQIQWNRRRSKAEAISAAENAKQAKNAAATPQA